VLSLKKYFLFLFYNSSTLKYFREFISVFLLLCSALFIVPKELIHELSYHHDTIDACHNDAASETALSNEHHHCDILEVFVQPYNAPDAGILFSSVTEIISQYTFISTSPVFEVIDSFSIRGPPSFSSC
jgi:hypothetical protein